MNKKIIIIGAGIAGLSTGCYGQKNGFETEIFEMHNLPGGLCTSWKRKDYLFDGCIHWLMGARPGTTFYKYWTEIGALDGLDFYTHKIQRQVENKLGQKFISYSDVDLLEKELLNISLEDKDLILELTSAVRKLKDFDVPVDIPTDMYSLGDKIKMLVNVLPKIGIFVMIKQNQYCPIRQ